MPDDIEKRVREAAREIVAYYFTGQNTDDIGTMKAERIILRAVEPVVEENELLKRSMVPPSGAVDYPTMVSRLQAEIARLRRWVDDLQSGMFINCVYCGHRYGPSDSVQPTMQKVLYDHIARCPKHPLSRAQQEIARLKRENERLKGVVEAVDILIDLLHKYKSNPSDANDLPHAWTPLELLLQQVETMEEYLAALDKGE